MKTQLNELKRIQQLAGILKEFQINGEAIPFSQWKQALNDFIQKNLTSDIDELGMLNDVLKEIIADNEQEIVGDENQVNEAKESDTIIPKSLVTRYVNMKSLFGDKAKDLPTISKLIPIVTDFFPKNLDISYQELENNFGEETANQVQTVLFGAYIDGYLDRFQEPITRLNHERDAKYPD